MNRKQNSANIETHELNLLATLLTISFSLFIDHNGSRISATKTNPMPSMITFKLANIDLTPRYLTPNSASSNTRRPSPLLARCGGGFFLKHRVNLRASTRNPPSQEIRAGQPRVALPNSVGIRRGSLGLNLEVMRGGRRQIVLFQREGKLIIRSEVEEIPQVPESGGGVVSHG